MDMFKCSDQRDFAEQPEKDSFSSSSKLYQFLSTRLQNLSVSIKTFLEFVSNSILYLLGFNPQMFERSGSGDGSGASCKKSSYFDYKKDDASENGDSCGAYSSTKYLSGDSGNELDSSDSESRCCFAVSRLKRLVLRQSRQRYHARRRHEICRIKQKAHESETPKRGKQNLNVGDGQKENITSITGCSTEEDKIRLQNTPSTERKEEVSLSKSISAEEIDQSVNIETLQDLCRKSVTCSNFEKTLAGSSKALKGFPKSVFTKTKKTVPLSPRKQVSESPDIDISPGYNQETRNMPVSTMNSGHTSSMTVEISSVADQFDIKRDENENMKTENADIKNETTNTGKNNADGLNLSCALVSPVNMNEVIEVASGRLSSNSILFNKIMVEVSCQPLEKAEEDDIRNVLNPCVISSDPVYDRLEHVTRIYCTTTQALRQKLKVRDTIFDVAIHSCRRSIYNYINWRTEEHREKSCDTETLYFKVMIYFYKYFKQCALDQNHDISRFIKKSKDETEREFLINTDKEIATAVRRLNQMDTEDHILSSIKTLFQENSETIKKKKDIEPINGEVSSKTKTECAPEIRPDNVDQTKQKVSGYLTRFGDEGAETNKSFHESIECLADHFSQLVVKDNHLEPVEGQSLPTDVRNTPTEGKVKTCFKLKVFHFNPQISVFSRESRKSETRFDQINPWKAVNITTDLRENFTTTSLSPIETTAEKLDELMDAEYIRDDATNTNLDVKLDRPENRDALDNMIERLQTEISTLRPVTERQNYYGIGDAEIIRSMMMREYPGVFTDSTTDTDSYDADTEEDTLGDIYRHLEKLKKKELDENSDGKQATNEERMTEQEIHDQPEVNEERSKGEKKRQPPPVPKKPTVRADGIGRQRKKQPPPVPKKPDLCSRRAASQNRQLFDEANNNTPSNNENNSFMPRQHSLYLSSEEEDGMACSLAQRIFKDMTSYSDDEQERITDGPGYEIVIRGDGAYEVIRNLSGTETLVPNVPDFKFGHSVDESDSEAVPCKKHVQEGVCDTDMTIKIRTRPANEFTDEKYEEHFDIDRSVYDQSGCKIMPRSCKKVNPRVLEQKDKKKTKTKGVANKHLMKAFNDADQSQEYYDDENENELRPLKELDELENDNNNEFENGNVDIEDENKHSTKVNEIRAESEPENPGVNVSYVEDMRHWQMLPTEVRRKYDDENNFDDKYSMSSKGTPEDKKKGKKKKQKKQKAQPLSLLELNFQFQ